MWRVDNRTPYAADSGWIRDGEGAESWVVAVKATYDLQRDGTLRLSETQEPVHSGPIRHSGQESLRYETDLGPSRAATDVLLNGHAHSPGIQAVGELPIAFRVGSISRSAVVIGDRHWRAGFFGQTPSRPEPFFLMPLVYERAFGGGGAEDIEGHGNPVGRGLDVNDAGLIAMPNIEHPEMRISSPWDRPLPVAFGPVPSHWPLRRRLAGTYDSSWFETRRPLAPVDLDPAFWQSVPSEQQVPSRLRGGEPVELLNLTPPGFSSDGRFRFVLPRLTIAFETHFFDGSIEHSRAVVHAVILEPDVPRVCMVYHMTLPCHPRVNLLERTVVREKKRRFEHSPVARPDESHGGWEP